jgi:hypothetical protein
MLPMEAHPALKVRMVKMDKTVHKDQLELPVRKEKLARKALSEILARKALLVLMEQV